MGVPILKAGSTYQLYALLCETQEDGWTKWVLIHWERDIVCLGQQGMGQTSRPMEPCRGWPSEPRGSVEGVPQYTRQTFIVPFQNADHQRRF